MYREQSLPLFHTITGTSPSFTKEPQDTAVFFNATLSLSCVAVGDPIPNITWYLEGQLLGNESIIADGSLLIQNIVEWVNATCGGMSYHCTASNTFGTIRSRKANVTYACELKELGFLSFCKEDYFINYFPILSFSFQWSKWN